MRFWKKLDKPYTILDIWNSCNLRCSFCYHDYIREKKDFFKPYSEIKKWIEDISKRSNFVIILWWETLLHPNIWDIMNDFKNNWVAVSITTSGYFFTDKSLLKKLLKYENLTNLTVSIHTIFPEDWVWIYWDESVVPRINSWIDNLMEAVEKYNKYIFLVNSITWNKYNYKNLWKTIRFLHEKWFNIIQLSTIHAYDWYGFSKKNYDSLVPYIYLKKVFEEIEDLLDNGFVFIVKSMPLCLHRFFIKYNYWIKEFVHWDTHDSRVDSSGRSVWENQNKYKLELEKCKNCYAYKKYCFWSYKHYDKKYSDREFKSLSKEEVMELKHKKFDTLKNHNRKKAIEKRRDQLI